MSLERIGNRYASALMELCSSDMSKAKEYLGALTELATVFEDKNI